MRSIARAMSIVVVALAFVAMLKTTGESVPLYAARTGNMCATCHFDPNGGGPRNEFGFAFARNRHSLDPEPEGSRFKDLNLVNRIGENMPVYVGLNQRFMAITTDAGGPDGIDRFGFFNMENGIHLAFQPHPSLTLSYTVDVSAFSSASTARVKDAYGMFTGLPMGGYIRAGRFRNPFGLRMDDHTVATRNGFLDFGSQESFLPYDPRDVDTGVEVGGSSGPFFGRVAFTNGPLLPVDVLAGNSYAETKSIKLGMNRSWYQGGISFYDAFDDDPGALYKRATRWGYYGMTHRGPFAVLGEVDAGTDERDPAPGLASGPKTNRFAWFAELDYAPARWANVRARYDRLVVDRSTNDDIRDANTHQRYALEAEVVPVPFGEIRATVRRIDHEDATAYGLRDETQGYVQFHFSY